MTLQEDEEQAHEEEIDQEAPADDEDAETEGGEPEAEKGEAADRVMQTFLEHRKWSRRKFSLADGFQCPDCDRSDFKVELTEFGIL